MFHFFQSRQQNLLQNQIEEISKTRSFSSGPLLLQDSVDSPLGFLNSHTLSYKPSITWLEYLGLSPSSRVAPCSCVIIPRDEPVTAFPETSTALEPFSKTTPELDGLDGGHKRLLNFTWPFSIHKRVTTS